MRTIVPAPPQRERGRPEPGRYTFCMLEVRPRPAAQPHRRPLPQVTLVAVDTRSPELALRALSHSSLHLDFARCLLLTHGAPGLTLPPHIEAVDIGPIRSSAEYSRWILASLLEHVQTSHVLVTQWDGFVCDPSAWDDAFLDADYLGAPWGKAPQGFLVGNGGFSLRSRRLLECLQAPAARALWHHPEDVCIGQTLRPLLEAEFGIRFGSLDMARRFACENEPPPGPCFGFHGVFNLHRALDSSALCGMVQQLPAGFANSRDGFKWARALLQAGMPAPAWSLLQQRLAGGATDWRTRWMHWRARRQLSA